MYDKIKRYEKMCQDATKNEKIQQNMTRYPTGFYDNKQI